MDVAKYVLLFLCRYGSDVEMLSGTVDAYQLKITEALFFRCICDV